MLDNVLIRADGSKEIGMGHINRSLIISKYLSKKFGTKCTLIRKAFPLVDSFIESKSDRYPLTIESLPEDISLEEEVSCLKELSKKGKSSLLILDLLEEYRPAHYVNALIEHDLKLMLISDSSVADNTPCHYFINGNPCLDPHPFTDNQVATPKRFLGPSNFIMNEAHYLHKPKYPEVQDIDRILVTIGGTDHNNILFKILDSMEKVYETHNIEVLVVSSKAAGYADKLELFLTSRKYKSDLLFDIGCLSEIWSRVDIAITAGGNTLFERIAAGIPGMTITQLNRQTEIAKKFEELGVNIHIGFGVEVESHKITSSISNFLSSKDDQIEQYLKCKSFFNKSSLENIFSKI